MKEYEVVIKTETGIETHNVCADFIHIKDGVACLYLRGESLSRPEVIAAYPGAISVTRRG